MKKFFKITFYLSLFLGLIGTAVVLFVGIFYYARLTRDLPRIERISDYRPEAITSIYDKDKNLIAELYSKRRYPAKFEEIPQQLKNAFLAAEDADFYKHPGISFTSILRAVWNNFRNRAKVQGGSTITQQIVKSLLLTNEKTYERKVKEAILSYRIENALKKDEILTIYLNEIFLGNTAYGVKAAAWIHFRKNLDELNLAESAYIAGLPPRPSYLSDIKHRKDAISRQHYVLDQMIKNKMITEEEKDAAINYTLQIYPPDGPAEGLRIIKNPYFVLFAEQEIKNIFSNRNESDFEINPGGYKIYTTVDSAATLTAQVALQKGLRKVDKRRGWRGSQGFVKKEELEKFFEHQDKLYPSLEIQNLTPDTLYRALVVDVKTATREVSLAITKRVKGKVSFPKDSWANRFLDKKDSVTGHTTQIDILKFLNPGQIIEVSLADLTPKEEVEEEPEEPDSEASGEEEDKKQDTVIPFKTKVFQDETGLVIFKLDQTPDIEGAMVLTKPESGELKVLIGGYDYEKSGYFNRATQALRQPGSAFKPFVYLTALQHLPNMTPATIVPDSEITLTAGNGELWTPGNFDGKFLGPITLRTALEKSRNTVAVYLIRRVGVQRVIDTAKKFGLTSKLEPNLSIALGSSEVKLLELTRAYGVFAAKGNLSKMLAITSISDRNNNPIYEQPIEHKQVISEGDAFLMANMMKGVIDRGTATSVKVLKRPVAGKTGTTNEHMDAWFVGYTPQDSLGVWVGFDTKKPIGNKETGGKVAAPIFIDFMQTYLKDVPAEDFTPPEGVVPVMIDRSTGSTSSEEGEAGFQEYFKEGSEPSQTKGNESLATDYLIDENF